jgi:thiol-disulfide isomerase/thioredoxin
MYAKFLLAAWLVLYSVARCFAQQGVEKFNIGDTLPDLWLGMLYDSDEQLKLSNFEDKLIILDFWNTSCGSCIRAMPKLDSIQKKFKNRLQILTVTENSKEEVSKLFSKVKIRKPSLPMLVSDRLLHRYFPHTTVPHHVWIDNKRIIRYITDGYNTNIRNIEDFFRSKAPKLHFKNEQRDFDVRQLLISEAGDSFLKKLQMYSTITGIMDAYGGNGYFINYDTINQQAGLKIINAPLLFLYKAAFGGLRKNRFADNRIVVNIQAPDKLLYSSDSFQNDQWKSKNLFCYESRIAIGREKELYTIMQDNLKLLFPYDVKVEKRPMMCYVLKRTSKEDKLKTKNVYEKPYDDGYVMQNVPFCALIDRLEAISNSFVFPFANDIDYNGAIDFKLNNAPNEIIDVRNLRRQLKHYGLDLVEEIRPTEVLVIMDKDSDR